MGNYLRMRGEETGIGKRRTMVELPPHARRRAFARGRVADIAGITSACAEKSALDTPVDPHTRNYLRMRGEEEYEER